MADEKAEFEVELIDRVSGPAKKGGTALERLRANLQRFNSSSIGKATQKVAEFAKNAMVIGSVVAAAVAVGIASMATGWADFGQRSRVALGLLLKGQAAGDAAFMRTRELAKELGLDIQETTAGFQKFLSVGFSTTQAETLVKMGADMRALGASGEKVNSIMDAMGKIKATGTLQGDELQMLAEAGLNIGDVYARLGKRLGKTTKEIVKMKEAGLITAGDALNAIGEVILSTTGTKQFGEAGRKMATSTLSGMAGVMKARLQDTLLTLSEKAAPALTEAFGAIGQELMGFLDSGAGKGFIQGIADALIGAAKAVKSAIPFIKEFIGGFASGASETWKALVETFKALFGTFEGDGKQGIQIARQLGQAIGQLAVILAGAAVVFGGMVAGITVGATFLWNHVKATFDGISQVIASIVGPILDAFANVSAIFDATGMAWDEKLFGIGKAIVLGLVRGIHAMAMAPVTAMQNIGLNAIAAAKKTLGIASPSKVFEGIGENVGLGFKRGVEGEMPTVRGTAQQLGSPAGLGSASSGAGGGSTFAPVIQVTAAPGATKEDGEALGAGIADALERKYLSWIEGTAIEAGVAA